MSTADVGEEVTPLAARRPAVWGLVAGLAMAVVGSLLFADVRIGLAVGVPFGLANGLVWREGGPARRLRAHLLRRFPARR